MYCIYKITNLINGKTYIGQHKYKKLNDSYLGSGKLIKQAIDKYGKENFKKEILYSNIQYRETVDDMERFAIAKERAKGKAEYNIADGGNGGLIFDVHPMKGKHHSEETKQKLREAKLGKEPWNKGLTNVYSEEALRNMSEASKCKLHSEETKKKMSEKRKGRQPMKGKHHSEETKMLLSKIHKGRKLSKEDKAFKSEVAQKRVAAYREYKNNGGLLSWNDFQKEYSKGEIKNV